MTCGSLSIEARGPAMLRELGISLSFLSALTQIEQTRLSYCFRQLKSFSASDAVTLATTLQRLTELKDALSPLAIDFSSPAKTRQLLDALEGLTSEEIRERVVLNLFAR